MAVNASCFETTFEDTPMTVCATNPAEADIRLWHRGADGAIIGTFERLKSNLSEDDLTLVFAMNGGMYHDDREPVGYFLGDEGETQSLVMSTGPGNFGMLPNGVLCIGNGTAQVLETRRFVAQAPACRYASQSGPMLVIEDTLHPRFLPDSDSTFVRNGVGVSPDGILFAAISNRPVSFHRFARFFRDVLGTPNALYIDGRVSRLYAPELGRQDPGFPMGPMLGVVAPSD